MKKIIIIIVALALILIVGAFVHFVGGITSGNSVIKKYYYSGDFNDFVSHIQSFSMKNSNVLSKITDTTGTTQKGYTFYVSIELRSNGHDILYSIACQNMDKNATSGTSIELVMAFDKINNVGGYRKEAKGIKPLVNYFDNFLTLFGNSQGISITALN